MANTDPEQARGKAGLAAAYGGIAFGLLGGIAVLVARVRAACHGDFTYPLDDTYIHMALAKNLEASGVWGVSPEGFSGSTSSPLWAMVLAWAFSVLGPTVWAPLVLNILLSLGVVWLWTGWVLRRGLPVWATAVTVLAGVALTPLPALAVLGMEHVLQVLTTSALVFSGARVLGGARGGPLLALGEHSPRKWLKARDWREQWPPGARFRARTVPAGVLAGWRGSWPWNCGKSAPRLARGVPSAGIGGPIRALGKHSVRIHLKSRRWLVGLAPRAAFRARSVPAAVFGGWRRTWPWNAEKSAPRLARAVASARIGGAVW